MKKVNRILSKKIEDTIMDIASIISNITYSYANGRSYSDFYNPGFLSKCSVWFPSNVTDVLPNANNSEKIKKRISDELNKYKFENINKITNCLFEEMKVFITKIFYEHKGFRREVFLESDAKEICRSKDKSYLWDIEDRAPHYFGEILGNVLGEILMEKFLNESKDRKNADADLSILGKLSASAKKLSLYLNI